jgi:Predicted S-adenosylmethionine-dependent methyltransferase involved in cell envelope biogenesis
MVQEVLEYLRPQSGQVYVDCTLGGGGHAEAALA